MAVTFWSNSDRGYRIRLLIEEGNTYPSSNESDVRYWLTLHSESTYFAGYNVSAVVIADGQSLNYSGQTSIGPNSVITLIDRTIRTKHNPNGEKYVTSTAQLTGSGGFSPNTLTIANVGLQLTTLKRATNISSTNAYLGQPLTITLDDYNSSYRYDIRYNWQGNTGTIATSVSSRTIEYTPPLEFAENIPNAKLHAITFYCDTYSGSSLIGTTQSVSTLTVPSSMKPTIGDLVLEETTSTLEGISTATDFVQILSRVRATLTGTSGAYGSTVLSCKIEVDGQNMILTQNGGVFDFFKNSGTFTIRANVTDSRGMVSDSFVKTIKVLSYFTPVIDFSVARSGVNQDILTVTRTAKIAPLIIDGVQKNTFDLKFKFAPHGSSDYIESTGNANEFFTDTYELLNSLASLVETFPNTKSFDIVATLRDKFFPSEAKQTIGTITLPLTVKKDGLGIGKTPEIRNGVDSAYPYYYNGSSIQNKQLSENDGTALLLSEGADLNTVISTGFYRGMNLLHRPEGDGVHEWTYIRVTSSDSNFVLQEAIDFNGVVSAYRNKVNGSWTNWEKYATVNSLKNQINTGWVSAGFQNSYYKRCGDILTVRYNFTGNGNTFTFAKIPPEILTAPQSYMFTIPNWSISGGDNAHVQVDEGSSNFNILASSNGVLYRGQITIMI
ncbi:putative tail protein [Streptococcus phage P738]|nr:putative tail protein [Streptococcus phage P738]